MDKFSHLQRRGLLVLCVLLPLIGTGCYARMAHTPYTPGQAAPRRPVPPEKIAPFQYESAPIEMENHDLWTHGGYVTKRVSFPAFGENGQPGNLVTAHYFKSLADGPKKLVIVLPIWGVSKYPPRETAELLVSSSKGNTNVLWILGDNRIFDWEIIQSAQSIEEFRKSFVRIADRLRTAVIDVRRIIDWAENQPDIDPQRIGLLGFSLSAIVASGVASVDDRLSALVLVFGGAHPADIMTYCTGYAQETKEMMMERFGWSAQRYHDEIEPIWDFLDPVNIAGKMDPQRILMFEAGKDSCMPENSRKDLWMAMGRPELLTLPHSHKSAFISFTPIGLNRSQVKIIEFFERVL